MKKLLIILITLTYFGLVFFTAYKGFKKKSIQRLADSGIVAPPGTYAIPRDSINWMFGNVIIHRDTDDNFTVETLNNSHWQLDPVTNTTVKFTEKNK